VFRNLGHIDEEERVTEGFNYSLRNVGVEVVYLYSTIIQEQFFFLNLSFLYFFLLYHNIFFFFFGVI